MEIQPEVKVKRKRREREKERETRGKTVQRLAPSSIVQKAFYTFDKHGFQWTTQNYVAFATQILSVSHFVYKRSQVIYIIFWPRGLLKLFGSLP